MAVPLVPVAALAVASIIIALGLPLWLAIAAGLGALAALTLATEGSKWSVISPTEWREFPLTQKTQLSPNTAKYRFALPRPDASLGLPIGQHISLAAEIDGKECFRSYTPVTLNDTKGYFELVVKTYPTGNMSRYLDQMKIGSSIRVRGPKGNMIYRANMVAELGMIAGGTGITPMYQVALAALREEKDLTKISLIYANNTAEDILLREELDALAQAHPDRFRVYYVLLEAPKGWQGGEGFVTKDMVAERLPNPTSKCKILICGPPPMVKAMTGHCAALGFPPAQAVSKVDDVVFKF